MSDTQGEPQGVSGLFKEYVEFLKDHKVGGVLSFFGFLVATGKIASFTALIAQFFAFIMGFMRKSLDWMLGVEQGKEREEIVQRLKRSRLWLLGYLIVFFVIPLLGVFGGAFVSRWIAFCTAFYIFSLYTIFALVFSGIIGGFEKVIGRHVPSVPRPTTVNGIPEWRKLGGLETEFPSTAAGKARVYGIRMAQAGLIIGLTQFLMWGFSEFIPTLQAMSPTMRNFHVSGTVLRGFATMGLMLLLFTVPLVLTRRWTVIYNGTTFILILLTPLWVIFSGPIAKASGMNRMSAWGDVNRDVAINDLDLGVLSTAVQHPDTTVTLPGDTLVYYEGLPHSDGYYGDINGDGRFNWADVEYLRRYLKQGGSPPFEPELRWSSVGRTEREKTTTATKTAADTTTTAEANEEEAEQDTSTVPADFSPAGGGPVSSQQQRQPSYTYAPSSGQLTPPPQPVEPVHSVRSSAAPPEQTLPIVVSNPQPAPIGLWEAGDTLSILAKGAAQFDGPLYSTPEGNTQGRGEQYPGSDFIRYGELYLKEPSGPGELIHRVRLRWAQVGFDNFGTPVYRADYLVRGSGELAIGYYDAERGYYNNTGSFNVTVKRRPNLMM